MSPDHQFSRPLISVVIPIYNVENYIQDCMDSLLLQDDRAFEVVVVDDGSTDASVSRVENYLTRFDNLSIHAQPNRGLGAARNAGLAHAHGDFVTFVDSDDVISSGFLSSLRSHQALADYDVVTSQVHMVSETLEFLRLPAETSPPPLDPPVRPHELLLGMHASNVACGRLYKKALLTQLRIAFPEAILHEDLFFTHKILRGARRVANAPTAVYKWRFRPTAISKTFTPQHVDVLPELRRDTYRYLTSVGAEERECVFAARRNLRLLVSFHRRAAESGSQALDAFYSMLLANAEDIHDDIARLHAIHFSGDRDTIRQVGDITSNVRGSGASRRSAKRHVDLSPAGPALQKQVVFVFLPLRRYHLEEAAVVITELRRHGWTSLVVNTDNYRRASNEVTVASAELGINTLRLADLAHREIDLPVVVFWNDWDPLMRILARACHLTDVTTVGWVEGVNDYRDVDTGRQRHAYLRSAHVIVPGPFDEQYFMNTGQGIHVGEVVRVARLWNKRIATGAPSEPTCALINSNFSYGVLEDRRDTWVRSAVEACLASGFRPVISRHPFDEGQVHREFDTSETFEQALVRCHVSIREIGFGCTRVASGGCSCRIL